jgi:hypothetical protein
MEVLLMKKMLLVMFGLTFVLSFAACAPEVGSKDWCAQMKEKPKGDWSSNEMADYAKHCIL